MRNAEILLHHRAGAADLVADHGAELRQQQIMHRALDTVAVGLVLRRDVGWRANAAACGCGGRRRWFWRPRECCPSWRLPALQLNKMTARGGRTLLVAIDLLALLVALLRFDRQRRDRAGFEPLQRDRLAGLLAIAVGVVVDALQRGVDLGDQLALAVAGAQLDGAVGFRGGAVGEIGMVDVLFLQRLQRDPAIPAGSRPSRPAAWRGNNRAAARS